MLCLVSAPLMEAGTVDANMYHIFAQIGGKCKGIVK